VQEGIRPSHLKNQTFKFTDELTVSGQVTFDTVMDTSVNAAGVLTTTTRAARVTPNSKM